jgi:hypothetical protein
MCDERVSMMHCAWLHCREAEETEEQRRQQPPVPIEDNGQRITTNA